MIMHSSHTWVSGSWPSSSRIWNNSPSAYSVTTTTYCPQICSNYQQSKVIHNQVKHTDIGSYQLEQFPQQRFVFNDAIIIIHASLSVSKLSNIWTMLGCWSPLMISISLLRLRSSFSDRPTFGINFKATTYGERSHTMHSNTVQKWSLSDWNKHVNIR